MKKNRNLLNEEYDPEWRNQFFSSLPKNPTPDEIKEWEWWWLGTLLSILCGFAILMAIRSIRSPLKGILDGEASGGDDAKVNLGGHQHGAGGPN